MITAKTYTELEATALEREGRSTPGGEPFLGFTGLPVDQEWREVRRYTPTNPDGHEAIVSVMRMPAMFWRVQCLDLGIDLDTGSGMHELVDSIARAIAGGMLGRGKD